MEEDLLRVGCLGRIEPGMAVEACARGRVARLDGVVADEQLRVGTDDGKPEVAVVEHHVRGGLEALVAHDILDKQVAGAHARGNTAREQQVFAEEGRLAHTAFDAQHILLPTPLLNHADVFGRDMRDAAVQAERLAGVFVGVADLGEAAGGHEAAAKRAQPAEPLWLVLGGRAKRGEEPGEGTAGEVGGADVERTVEEDLEAEAAAGVDVGDAHAAGLAVGALEETDAGELAEGAGELGESGGGVGLSKEFRHLSSLKLAIKPHAKTQREATKTASRKDAKNAKKS